MEYVILKREIVTNCVKIVTYLEMPWYNAEKVFDEFKNLVKFSYPDRNYREVDYPENKKKSLYSEDSEIYIVNAKELPDKIRWNMFEYTIENESPLPIERFSTQTFVLSRAMAMYKTFLIGKKIKKKLSEGDFNKAYIASPNGHTNRISLRIKNLF